ncbi:MAG: hypothetical protein H7Y17_08760 [Chlorobia bacterium]|nr:hypothetical protein [Fimbriimonadaceae bacterium]
MKSVALALTLIGCSLPMCEACQESIAPEKHLDFWVGEWKVVDTTPNAKNPPGTNSIKKIYGGKVVHENFKMGAFEGQSWSVFNPRLKVWQQTWVDNSGGYLDMTSLKAGNNLAIQTIKKEKAPMSANRMVFSGVKPNSFTWRWEATTDGGKTWKLSWQLQYTRNKPAADLSKAILKATVFQQRHSWY